MHETMKILIIYYSRKGENYVNGGIEDLKKGNTEIVAESIQRARAIFKPSKKHLTGR